MTRWDKIKKGITYSFKGGVYPSEHKNTCNTPSAEFLAPKQLILPLRQHSGSAAEILVKEGQHVLAKEPLTAPKSKMQVPIHAPLSGTIVSVSMEPIAHPSGLKEPCIVLKPDEKQSDNYFKHPTYLDYVNKSPSELIEHIKNMGIAGLGGAGFPTDVKLSSSISDNSCELLIINGAECEPYITCDDRLMQEKPNDVINGIKILQYILKPKYTVIAIEDNKPVAISNLKHIIEEENLENTRVTVIPVKYPSGAARNLIAIITGIEIPYNARSNSYGIVVHNVTTAYTVGEAILKGEPLIKRMITVAGTSLAHEGNVWTYIGTSVIDILHYFQYTPPKNPRVIMGGPMMGFTLHQANVPVIKTTNCIIAPSDHEIERIKPQVSCIRCGRCAKACPSRLIPYELYDYCHNNEHELALKNGLKSCIECGCCSFVCPSAIRLVAEFRMEKAQINIEKQKAKKLKIAQERFKEKSLRLEEEARIRSERKAQALAKIKLQNQAKANVTIESKQTDILAKQNSQLTPEEKELRKQAAIAKAKAIKDAKLKEKELNAR
ncbi:MAG: electron transport complex subunit RsxC [Succinivibrionaceae bacterium]